MHLFSGVKTMQNKFSKLLFILILASSVSQPLYSQTRRRPASQTATTVPPKPHEAPKKRRVTVSINSGETISGDFVLATSEVLRVEVAGVTRTINLDDVISVVFEAAAEAQTGRSVKLTPQAKTAARDALKALRKMAGATEIGINLQEYGSRIIDAKADVEEALRQLPDGDLKLEISLAMDAYADASKGWNQMLRYDFLLVEFEPGQSLQKKYSIPIDNGLGSKAMTKNAVLSTIWGAARSHLEKAETLLN
jgi:hypothetical protein